MANSAGFYNIPALPGTYILTAFKSNFVSDVTAAANLVLNSGVNFSTNLGLLNATETIAGSVVDANNAGIGLTGVFSAGPIANRKTGHLFFGHERELHRGRHIRSLEIGRGQLSAGFQGLCGHAKQGASGHDFGQRGRVSRGLSEGDGALLWHGAGCGEQCAGWGELVGG